jgi:hypothetical protein
MSRFARYAAGLVLALGGTSAFAFTPESGYYWNPAASGSGLSIEIQDNYVFLIGYVYDAQGNPTWVSAQGLLSGNAVFNGQLDRFIGGQCIGCAYTAPTAQPGVGGPITLNWATETTATLTWGGRTIPLQRFDYYLTRTGGIDAGTEKMLGEWQVVLDLYNSPGGNNRNFPYFGDVLVFDTTVTTTSPDQAQGCRPTTSLDGRCTTAARTAHDAAATFSPNSPTAPPAHSHIITVRDTSTDFFAYYVTVGTYQFDGVMEICTSGNCGNTGATYYPVRGFRSASRKFVQDGTGPSSNDKAAAIAPEGLSKLLAQGGEMPRGLTAAEVKARFGFDPAQLAGEANGLIATMARR